MIDMGETVEIRKGIVGNIEMTLERKRRRKILIDLRTYL